MPLSPTHRAAPLAALLLIGSTAAWAEPQGYFRYRGEASGNASPDVSGNGSNPSPRTLNVSGPASVRTRSGSDVAMSAPSATGTSSPVTWSFLPSAGAPPGWARVDPSTGAISGKALGAGSFPGLVLQASDGTHTGRSMPFAIEVLGLPAASVPPAESAPRAHVGTTLSIQPVPTGIVGTPTWSFATLSGTLAGGLVLDSGTGLLQGKTLTPGNARLTLRVEDSSDKATGDTGEVSIQVIDPLRFSTQPGSVDAETLSEVSHSGPAVENLLDPARKPVSYALLNGGSDISASLSTACQGLLFSASQGTVRGVPQAACDLPALTLVATDAVDATTATSAPFHVKVVPTSTAVLDPAKTASGFMLSNGGRTATNTVGGRISSLATVGHKTGDGSFYWEAQTNGLGNGDEVNIGFASDYTRIVSDVNSGGPAWSFSPGYNFIAENGRDAAPISEPRATAADTVMVAWNGTTVWWGLNGQWKNGNPTTGTGGYGFAPGGRTVYPAVSLGRVNSTVTVRFGGFKHAPPAGFVGWR